MLLLIALLKTLQILLEILTECSRKHKCLQYILGDRYRFFCAFMKFKIGIIILGFGELEFIISGDGLSMFL